MYLSETLIINNRTRFELKVEFDLTLTPINIHNQQ